MELHVAELALVVLGIILALLQIAHAIIGIRKDTDNDSDNR